MKSTLERTGTENGQTPLYNEQSVRRHSHSREGSAAWTVPSVIDAWRRGRWEDVPALTMEYSPSLVCNLNCSTCPYLGARRQAGCRRRVPRGEFADADDKLAASLESAAHVLQRCREAAIRGVLWTGGGEPTLCRELPEMIRRSAALGMYNALYSNLIQVGMHSGFARSLLAPGNNLVFVRGSLNVARPETGRVFCGASPEDIQAQYDGFAAVCDARESLLGDYREAGLPVPLIQASVICDHRNVGDLSLIAEKVAHIYETHCVSCRSPHDDFVVRPLTKHGQPDGYTCKQHDEREVIDTIRNEFQRSDAHCGTPPGPSRVVLERAGMNVFMGFGLDDCERRYEDLLRLEYESRTECLANGLFLTVGPDETVHLCTDRNCDTDWIVGDLRKQSVDEIYHSDRRRELLARVHFHRCGPKVCEPTCRLVRLNAIAQAVRSGDLTDADIDEIRRRGVGERGMLLS